jgi:predicted PurR-regulated permease PerM
MSLINNSQDLLCLVISVSILALALFTCWAIFYLAMILKQSSQIVKEMRQRLHKVDTVIDSLKEKIEHSASYLLLIGEGVKKLVEVIRSRAEKKRTTGRRTKKEEE